MTRHSPRFLLLPLLMVIAPAHAQTDTHGPLAGIASHYDHPTGRMACPPHAVYDRRAMTAAHRTLPCGTRLSVRLVNSRRPSLVVTVTDRGPFIPNRIIDLSMGAARALGFEGLARVQIKIVD